MTRLYCWTTCLVFAVGVPASAAEKPLILKVWPGKAPGVGAVKHREHLQPQNPHEHPPILRLTDVTEPTISVYRPAKGTDTGAAVLICPGGGYSILAWDLEGTEVANWLNSIGVTGVVLKYRVPRSGEVDAGGQPIGPQQDVHRALSLVRSRAKEWNIYPDRIGILGFSAGGHLSACALTRYDKRAYEPIDAVDRVSCRPDFGILIYPAYLLAKNGKLSPTLPVTKNTPPTFLAMTEDDPVNTENAIQFYRSLRHAKVPAELHLYPVGGHGYGLRKSKNLCTTWPKRCEDWLRSRRLLEERGHE